VRAEIVRLIREDGAEVDLFLGNSSANVLEAAEISAAMLEKLARLGIPLTLCPYPPRPIQRTSLSRVWRGPKMPAAKIRRFEVVSVVGTRMGEEWDGRRGTVIWCDKPNRRNRRTLTWTPWSYCVHFPDQDVHCSFLESDLLPTGNLEPEDAHLGRRHEISFDNVVSEDGEVFVEGSYRVPGRHWEIFTFDQTTKTTWPDQGTPTFRSERGTWESGITGIGFEVSESAVLNRDFMLKAMAEVFGTDDWTEVRGPDSMVLK
jgi:hypothetical protein